MIRAAIRAYLARRRHTALEAAIVAGYRATPQAPDRWVELTSRDAISAERW